MSPELAASLFALRLLPLTLPSPDNRCNLSVCAQVAQLRRIAVRHYPLTFLQRFHGYLYHGGFYSLNVKLFLFHHCALGIGILLRIPGRIGANIRACIDIRLLAVFIMYALTIARNADCFSDAS